MNTSNYTMSEPQSSLQVEIIIYSTIFVLGLSNFIVILAVIRNRKMHSVTNIYIVNLSLADAAMIGTLPFFISFMHYRDWMFGWAVCKLYWIFEQTNKYASIMFLTILSVDRYLAICKPMQSIKYRTKTIALGVVATVYFVVSVLLTPVYMFTAIKPGKGGSTICNIFWPETKSNSSNHTNHAMSRGKRESETHFFFFTVFFVFVIPVCVMMFYYALIIRKLLKLTVKANQLHGSRQTSQASRGNNRHWESMPDGTRKPRKDTTRDHYRNITRMIFVVIICHVICWTPVWVVNFMTFAGVKPSKRARVLFKIFHMLPYVNSAINPFLYGATNSNYRKTFRALLCCIRMGREAYRNRRWSNSMFDTKYERNRNSFVQQSLANVIMEMQMIVAHPGRPEEKKEAEIIYHSMLTGDTKL